MQTIVLVKSVNYVKQLRHFFRTQQTTNPQQEKTKQTKTKKPSTASAVDKSLVGGWKVRSMVSDVM
jgi:hypothetical protein